MLLQFLAVVQEGAERTARKIPVHGDLQRGLSEEFLRQRARLIPDDVEIIPYEPGYKPDDEIFRIPNYPLPTYLETVLNSRDLLPVLSDAEIESGIVKSILGIEIGSNVARPPRMLFQNFNLGQVIRRKGFVLLLDRELYRQSDRSGLRVDDKITAALIDGDLLFQSEFLVRRYLELDKYFTESTDEEIESFLEHPRLAPYDFTSFTEKADRWMRRKVTSIRERKILDRVSVEEIAAAGSKFGLEVSTTTTQGQATIQVPKEKKEIKQLLRLLDDDLLESALTDARYQVNSKRGVSMKGTMVGTT